MIDKSTLEKAAQACEAERVEDAGTHHDLGYNRAVRDCAAAVRSLATTTSTEPTGRGAAQGCITSDNGAADVARLQVSGTVCEIGDLEDENGSPGVVLKRMGGFVTIKGLEREEVAALGPCFMDEITISFGGASPAPSAKQEPALNGGMHASIFVKVWGDAGGGDAGRIALANYAYNLGKADAAPSASASPAAPLFRNDDEFVAWLDSLYECDERGTATNRKCPAAQRAAFAVRMLPPDWQAQALRQCQHNDCSGLVFGYDKAIIDRFFSCVASPAAAVAAPAPAPVAGRNNP